MANPTELNITLLLRRAAFTDSCVLANGEPGYHTVTKEFKIGDGVTTWKNLPFANKAQIEAILSGYKTKQTAKASPTASGTTLAFIDTITQNANGEITATKKTVDLAAYVKLEDLPKIDVPTVDDFGVLSVAKQANTAIEVSNVDPQNPTIGFKLDQSGNVALSQSNSGLKATVDFTGVKNELIGADTDTETANTIEGAKAYADARKAEVVEIVNGVASAGLTRKTVTALPTVSTAAMNTIYMIKRSAGLNNQDVYDEYIVVEVNGTKKFELLGNTELDLSDFYNKSDSNTRFKAKQTAKTSPSTSGSTLAFIDTISQDVNGEITATKKNVDLSAYETVTGAAEKYKTKQTAKTDPTANGSATTFISSITQNANGEITATKKSVDFTALNNHISSSHVTKVNAGTGIVVTPSAGTGEVTVSHKAYGTGTIKDVNHDSATDPSFVTGIVIENGHVTNATVQNLQAVLSSLILVLDGGEEPDTVTLQIL